MDIRKFSSQFTIYIYLDNVDKGAAIKVALSQVGYDVYFFQDPTELEMRLKDTPPHILLFATASLSGALSDFVSSITELCSEIQFIALSHVSQFDTLAQYNEFGLADIVEESQSALEARALWSVDRVCEKIYFTYQNEQLQDEINKTTEDLNELQESRAQSEFSGQYSMMDESLNLATMIAEYRLAASKEEIVQKFVSSVQDIKTVFFKYLPSVKSLFATHGNGFDMSLLQGVGCQFTFDEVKDLRSTLSLDMIPKSLATVLVDGLRMSPAKVYPLFVQNQIEGLLAYTSINNPQKLTKLHESFALFSLAYNNFYLEKKVDDLEVQDFTTEIYNRAYYLKRLREEVARSHRSKAPVSVIKLSIDNFFEIEQSLGEVARDHLLKSVATLISKTSRIHDFCARTMINEIALVLPDSARKGASVRAERVRRAIESTGWLDNGFKITVSLGVSEYPTLAGSAEALDESSTKALAHIMDKGGNKLCLFKAPINYKAEFEVKEE